MKPVPAHLASALALGFLCATGAALLPAGAACAADMRGANNATIGKIDSDGTVRSANNATIGNIGSDGTVRSANNATIGYAKGVKRSWAAGYFFFFFKK